jgi:hypothetical protein
MPAPARIGAILALLFAALAGPARPTTVQQSQESPAGARPRTAAALSPDTVRVGDPFTLGLSIEGPREAAVEFPPLVTLIPEIEQLRPVDVGWDEAGGGRWRARYRLAAWKAGTWSIPAVPIEWQGREISVEPPPVQVTSVLPAASAGPLPLEGPRAPRQVRGFPWWLLLLLLALLLLWWLMRRLRGSEDEEEPEWTDPAMEAREALVRLRHALEQGEVDLAAFYDGLEEVLRRYLAARRGWPAARPVREFVDEAVVDERPVEVEAGLRSLQGRAGLVRFAHVESPETAALDDADACLAWLEADEAEAA